MNETLRTKDFISLKNVTVKFNTKQGPLVAVDDVTLDVPENEFVSILGPSGCGKSTLLRVISGLLLPNEGTVSMDGKGVTGPVQKLGMMFQTPTLLRWRKCLDNILLPSEANGSRTEVMENHARELLALVGLEGFGERYPRELSGGMQQRVSLARSLLLDPPLLLMDEPFGALDALTREEMCGELVRIWENNPKTVVFVTHSIQEAVTLSDRIFLMTSRPGKIKQVFTVDNPRPVDRRRLDKYYFDLIEEIHEKLETGA